LSRRCPPTTCSSTNLQKAEEQHKMQSPRSQPAGCQGCRRADGQDLTWIGVPKAVHYTEKACRCMLPPSQIRIMGRWGSAISENDPPGKASLKKKRGPVKKVITRVKMRETNPRQIPFIHAATAHPPAREGQPIYRYVTRRPPPSNPRVSLPPVTGAGLECG